MDVYIVAAYPTVRAGLAALARQQPGWTVIGESGPEALTRALLSGDAANPLLPQQPTPPPDVILADLDLETDALSAALVALRPRGGIVALTTATAHPGAQRERANTPNDTLRGVSALARAAEEHSLAYGALLRDATSEEIIAALTAVAGGLITLDRRLAAGLLAATERIGVGANERSERLATLEEPLTPREAEVLQLLAQGLPNKLIAQRLSISEHTAKFHVSAIMLKLGAASRTEAVTRAARLGLLIL